MYKIAVIATKGDRQKQLHNTCQSLLNQVNEIRVYDNSKNIDLSDNAKFLYTDIFDGPVYYFTCDDDIIYPNNYINTTINHIEKYKCIISWHGRKLDPKADTYYNYPHTIEMRYFQENKEAVELDVAGTGVCGFRTDYFCPDIANSSYKRMSDLVFSLEACKQGKRIISPPKKHLWIKGQEVKSSIFVEEKNGSQAEQIKLMNDILRCKNG